MDCNKKRNSVNNDNENSDAWNICVLLYLYILQGIPMGLAETIPLILQNKKVTYNDQAKFSIAYWPCSLKVLWAPIVEAIPSNKFGKRKSVILPAQLVLGILLLIISMNIDFWLGDLNKGIKPNMFSLTIIFLLCYMLVAVQDVAVDGWAITMLKPKNIGHVATCDCVGGTIGKFLGYVITITLDSADFCNKWIRSSPQNTGIIPLPYSLGFWGIIYIFTTILIAVFKKEKIYKFENVEEVALSLKQSYMTLWEILKLRTVHKYIMLLLTCGVIFAPCISLASLKFVEIGVSKEKFAMMDIPLVPIHITLPFILSHFLTGSRPLNLILVAVPNWLILCICTVVLIYIAPLYRINNDFPLWYFIALFVLYTFQHIVRYCRVVSIIAFSAKCSDPRCASTYITLLHTFLNMGHRLPSTISIWLVDKLTWKQCIITCIPGSQPCIQEETCTITLDGFYIEITACIIFGIAWFMWAKKEVNELHKLDKSAWLLKDDVYY